MKQLGNEPQSEGVAMKIARAAVTAALVIVIVIGSLGSMVVVAASGLLLFSARPAYFPGDPAFAEVVLILGIVAIIFTTVAFITSFVAYRLLKSRSLALLWKAGLVSMLVSILSSLPAVAEVGRRNFGEWAELKQLIRESEVRARQFSDGPGSRLSEEEYDRAKEWFRAHPVTFRFKGLKQPVVVRMMRSVEPFVGVDFGNGQNAVFDPDTMFCLYSD